MAFCRGSDCLFLCRDVLVTHHITHLSVATCALTGALIAMLLGGHKMSRVLMNIDYPTIIFFAGLFIIVGAMEHVGLLKMAAPLLKKSREEISLSPCRSFFG